MAVFWTDDFVKCKCGSTELILEPVKRYTIKNGDLKEDLLYYQFRCAKCGNVFPAEVAPK